MNDTRGALLKKLETPRLILRHHQKEDFEQYRETEQSSAKDLSPWFGWINQTRGYNTGKNATGFLFFLT